MIVQAELFCTIVSISLLSQGITELEESSPMIPAKSEHFRSLFEYLESYHTRSGMKPVLLHIGCGDGRVGVAAADLCSQIIGIDASPLRVHTAIKMAFEQKVLDKSHFFQTEIFEDPLLLLGNPNLLADKIWEADVVFLHAFPSVLKKLMPLLAKLSDNNYEYMLAEKVKKQRKFVTLMYHLSAVSIDGSRYIPMKVRFIQGTDICVYDGVKETDANQVTPPSTPPRH